jgi:hypothetical protein
MKTLVRFTVLSLALAAACITGIFAQDIPPQGMLIQPTPLAATEPLAVKAAALVTHLLAGEKEAALKMIRAEGDDAYVNGGKMEEQVENQIARLAKGKYSIVDFQTAIGSDVIVLLETPTGDESNIVIRFTDGEKMNGFAQARQPG